MPELQITVSDLLERVASKEDRENHIDIAALLIREMLNSVHKELSLKEIVAGLPEEVVTRAAQILKNLEANDLDVNRPKAVKKPRKKLSELPGQMTFF